jgi:hypothetical protein
MGLGKADMYMNVDSYLPCAEMKCRVEFVDFEGRTDMVSMATLLAEVNARQMACGSSLMLALHHSFLDDKQHLSTSAIEWCPFEPL